MRQPPLDMVAHLARPALAGQCVEGDRVGDRCADPDQPRRKIEQLQIAPVPCDQVQIGIDHADPGIDILERRRQQPLGELQALPAFVQHPGDVVDRHGRA